MCEVFNGNMISLRYKAIYTLLEEIRVMVMRRHVERRAYPEKKFKGSFGDRIWPKIVSAGNASGDCHIVAREGDAYEVLSGGVRYVVNLGRRSCSCRGWNLTGIPCKHVYRIMVHRKEEIEEYVHPCYHRQTFLDTYQYSLKPVEGDRFWEKAFHGVIDPPELRKTNPGRKKKEGCKSRENGGAPSETRAKVQRGAFVLASSDNPPQSVADKAIADYSQQLPTQESQA
ncbi:hypothetical protein K2173_002204 [Erythroxylum novogranatense]|uniref:SWIM-type domain-containing protein n=1 Tax=Erythroxylum novogranatense TaxID=1862640 RepID=A0AAV8TTL3_9ROSI|nr:hypothetical protein K2173_002204 [Erythroxylum novogranatense]